MAMIAITTSNSIRVKALVRSACRLERMKRAWSTAWQSVKAQCRGRADEAFGVRLSCTPEAFGAGAFGLAPHGPPPRQRTPALQNGSERPKRLVQLTAQLCP